MLLDRFGPRRVEPVLLGVAGIGALAFGWADSLAGLVVGRALIGLGVCVCLMAPLKAFVVWYPPERQASLSGWMMVAGGLGALGATVPLEFALRLVSWRTIFTSLGVVTFGAALAIAWLVPDTPKPSQSTGLRAQWSGVRRVFADSRFWWIAPLGAVGMGSFMAIQGLWAVPWLMEVEGYSRAAAARLLLVMGVVILFGYSALGMFATRLARIGVKTRHLFAAGFALNALSLAAIVMHAPGGTLWWPLYGLGSAVNVLGFTVLNEGFPRELAGRVNTALNVLMFGGSFLAQWGIGVLVEVARDALEVEIRNGLQLAFAIVLALNVVTYVWFAWHWRRHAARTGAPLTA
jgi:predicted MFS family arabinose efflux permease